MHVRAYAMLCLVLLVAVGFYSYQKWNDYVMAKKVLESNGEFIGALKDEVSDEKSDYEVNRNSFLALNKEIEDKLSVIFPETDEYTELTRQMDGIEEDLSSPKNPFEISSIKYNNVVKTDKYSILPFSMNIRASTENFEEFLHKVENSGSLLDQIRLMDIDSIRLNFGQSGSGAGGGFGVSGSDEEEAITFTVQINAYYQ